MKTMRKDLTIKSIFWVLTGLVLAICSYFIIHNASWLLGDDCQTLIYTGWDKPIFGFFVSPTVGRFFPLDYTIYDLLLPFFDGQIPPAAHYAVHIVCFLLFIGSFIWLSLYILRKESAVWRYSITFSLVILVIGRTFLNYAQCWTGIWTIFTFLPVFIICSLRFLDTAKWRYGIIALLVINYVLYYYETMFVIPLSIGVLAFVFSVKQMSKQAKIYYASLIVSGLLFLLLYAILVLPKVENFYAHHSEFSLLQNAWRMFVAQKIMWLVVVFLIIRLFHLIKKETSFCFYDNLLLASSAYCVGAAILGLNYTLYYTPGVLIAIPAVLAFCIQYFRKEWTLALFIALALFYGRKIPKDIKSSQNERVSTYTNVQAFIEQINDKQVFFFEPTVETMENWEWEIRHIRRFYLEKVTGWYMQDQDFHIETRTEFLGEPGLWQVTKGDIPLFVEIWPDAKCVVDFGNSKVFLIE